MKACPRCRRVNKSDQVCECREDEKQKDPTILELSVVFVALVGVAAVTILALKTLVQLVTITP